jgi:integrase
MCSLRYFFSNTLRAGRSAWYDRRVRNAEAAGSNPARSTFTPARPFFESPLTLEVILDLKKKGKAEETINGYSRRLRHLAKNTDINSPETVKEYITKKESSNANKEAYANAYDHFVKFYGLKWQKPFITREERLPNVPTTEQVNTIIPTFTRKYTTIFSIIRDTGLRPVELHRLRLKNINLENGTITPKTAKNGAARILKLPNPTLAMLNEYLTKYNFKQADVLFPPTKKQCHIWVLRRNQLAKKLNQLELTKYRLYDLRHYYATMLYAKTKDILLVKQQLGHKRIEHTLIYTHLINFKTDEYTSKAVQILGNPNHLKEICQLAESGFTLFTKTEEYQIFRKPK